MAVLKKSIAEHLGVTKPRISQLLKLGMPVYSEAAALAWYQTNIRKRHFPNLRLCRSESKRSDPAMDQLPDNVASVRSAINQARVYGAASLCVDLGICAEDAIEAFTAVAFEVLASAYPGYPDNGICFAGYVEPIDAIDVAASAKGLHPGWNHRAARRIRQR
jgi:hypothetical protein